MIIICSASTLGAIQEKIDNALQAAAHYAEVQKTLFDANPHFEVTFDVAFVTSSKKEKYELPTPTLFEQK